MDELAGLPREAFAKFDSSPDSLFYAEPRFVTHIDDVAIAAITRHYRQWLPANGSLLDLMSSWVSHLPEETAYREVVGLGANARELDANPRLTRRFVQDLNIDPVLPFDSESFDAVTICVSIQYLQNPVTVLREVGRVLRPGGPVLIGFSNRCFPTKAVAVWGALGGADRARLVAFYLERAGFDRIETHEVLPEGGPGDPLRVVVGRALDGQLGRGIQAAVPSV